MTIHAEGLQHGRPVVPRAGRLQPLGAPEVQITGGHWGAVQGLNRDKIIPHIEHWLERAGWLGNFDAAAVSGPMDDRRGREFSDSEVYKLLEAMAWELLRAPDSDLEARYRRIVGRIAAAQESDGYLNTNFGRPGQGERWSDLAWGHELYCIGHLIQAGVARARTGHPDDEIVAVVRRAADLVCRVFGSSGNQGIDGHPVIETALVELYRVTGERRYLDQAHAFVERRGHGILGEHEFGSDYFLDDLPVRKAEVLRGHAVRAVYFSSAAVDLADELDDASFLDAVARQWAATVARRTYITGGMGSHHQDEAFGEDFVLPPDRAYSETCAGVGSVMLAWRLLLATGDPKYSDLVERTLFNVVGASPAADGQAFFYANTLHRRDPGTPPEADQLSLRASSSMRAPWFQVSCCPTNVARTLSSLDAYLVSADDEGVQVHQYFTGRVDHQLDDGRRVALAIDTAYPHDGTVTIAVESDADQPWTLSLRVPQWAGASAMLSVNGEVRSLVAGSVSERRTWRRGDVVVLRLPVEPRFTFADERIDSIRQCVAVERGPLVMAVESPDLPGDETVEHVRVDASVPPRLVDGRVVVRAETVRTPELPWPYSTAPEVVAEPRSAPQDIALVDYYAWANRGPSTMRVWIPTT